MLHWSNGTRVFLTQEDAARGGSRGRKPKPAVDEYKALLARDKKSTSLNERKSATRSPKTQTPPETLKDAWLYVMIDVHKHILVKKKK